MTQRCRVGSRIAEGLERRHLDVVGYRRIVGLRPAMANNGAGIAEEAIGILNPLDRIESRFRTMVVMVRQTVDLVHIEHGIRLQERDFPVDLIAIAIGFRLGEAAREHHSRAGFTLTNRGSELPRLLEGHPHRRGETPRHPLGP